MNPGLVGSPPGPHLGDDHQTLRVRMERLLDYLIGYMRSVEVAGIDVVHTGFNRLTQNSDGAVAIAWRSPHLRTRQLHGAITHAVHGQRSVCERKASTKTDRFHHSTPSFVGGCQLVFQANCAPSSALFRALGTLLPAG